MADGPPAGRVRLGFGIRRREEQRMVEGEECVCGGYCCAGCIISSSRATVRVVGFVAGWQQLRKDGEKLRVAVV